jgi:D-alanine-D-alanine ligase
VLGSALAMDKIVTKTILRAAGLPVVPGVATTRAAYRSDPLAVHEAVTSRLGLPVFVKPSNGGSSVGVSRVAEARGLAPALEAALACDRRVLVEVAIDAREIECAVVGNDEVEASILGEIEPSGEFYDYAAKYLDGTSVLHIPAELAPETAAQVRRQAVEAYGALDLAGFARVDFLLDRQRGSVYVNEVNTLPGFTPISMFPKLWEASGVAYPELITRLVRLAVDRAHEESQRQSNWYGDDAGLR